MKLPSQIFNYIERNPKKSFGFTFLFLIAYQTISVFYGFELCDSGFYMTFYDNIYKAPETVEYNFMYYLSGVTGGFFMSILPGAGIFEMRLIGLASNMLIVYLLYKLFAKHINMTAIIIGTVLIVLSYIAMPMTFYNDLLTGLLYVLAIFFLFKGFKNNSTLPFMASGLCVALNTFARIPNVLDFGIILLIVFHKFYYNEQVGLCIKQCLLFTASFIIGVIGIILFMKAMGHYPYFINNLRELTSIANDDSGTCSHTTTNMILAIFRAYASTFKFGLEALIPCLAIFLSAKYIRKNVLCILLQTIAFATLGYLFWQKNPVLPLCAFCLIGVIGSILLTKEKEVKMLAWAGFSMFLIIPIGSDGGMYNNGSIIFWLAAPVATAFYMNLKGEKLFTIPMQHVKQGMLGILVVYLLICGSKMIVDGIYFDGGLLFKKQFTIDNDRVRHIYTTQERADIMNELLKGIHPYIKKGDYLFAYGSLPAINYMTETKPFAGCSWPELLSIELLKKRLDGYNGALPILLRQKFNSIGPNFSSPSDAYLTDCGVETGEFISNRKQQLINEFVKRHSYQTVFENKYFILYLPPESHQPLQK